MDVYSITKEEALQLIELMQASDDIFYDTNSNWNEMYDIEAFAVFKSCLLFWVTKLLQQI